MNEYKWTGGHIREIRKQMGIASSELAEMVGVCRATISNYENGHRVPDIPMVNKIARALGQTDSEKFRYLFGFEHGVRDEKW